MVFLAHFVGGLVPDAGGIPAGSCHPSEMKGNAEFTARPTTHSLKALPFRASSSRSEDALKGWTTHEETHLAALPTFLEQPRLPLLLELVSVERLIVAACREQLTMRPALDDPTFFNHQNPVRRADRGQPVRDDEADAPVENRLQPLLDQLLRLGVDRGGGLIHDEDPGVRK